MSSSPLQVRGISKRFGDVQALNTVTLEFHPGEVHAVLGENGAGKSTLMGVLAGFVVPDRGSIELAGGSRLPPGRPETARKLGIGMVHQHFTLVPAFTVAESLALAMVESLGSVDVNGLASPALRIAKELGWHLDPAARIADLPVGVQQRVEILKALTVGGEVLIFDEPTAVLSPEEVEDLFRVIRDLRTSARTIILIAHKLKEVLAIADRVSVLRRGSLVATARTDEVDASRLAHWMVGDLPEELAAEHRAIVGEPAVNAERIVVRGDRGEVAVREASFAIAPGEILGFGGVDGNGQVELAEALAGVRALDAGTLRQPSGGAAYIPQDRQSDGLALTLSIQDNLLITGHRKGSLRSGPMLRVRAIRDWAAGLVKRFDVRIGRLSDPASSLSGGNQQKVVVARAIDQTPCLLVAVNPSRGLDIRATQFVHEQIRSEAQRGAAVALFSTDVDELATLAHRTVFMSGGRVTEKGFAAALGGGS